MQRTLRKTALAAGLRVLLVWSLFPLWFAVVGTFSTDVALLHKSCEGVIA